MPMIDDKKAMMMAKDVKTHLESADGHLLNVVTGPVMKPWQNQVLRAALDDSLTPRMMINTGGGAAMPVDNGD